MKNLSPFFIGFLIFCAAMAAIAMMIFSGALPGFKEKEIGSSGNVVMWGTINRTNQLDNFISSLNSKNKQSFKLSYVQKNPKTFEDELLDALARGQGPDMVLLPHELLLHQENKILLIPYTSYPEQNFTQTFVAGSQLFKRGTGVTGLPLFIDPLVMYYNDPLLTASGVALPPKFWTEIASPLSDGLLKKVTKADEQNNIIQSLIGLGVFDNVTHAKEILSLLIMQSGDQVVRGSPGRLVDGMGGPSVIALNYFIQFSNPTKEQYTWNSALPQSIDYFSSGKSALYIGFASDHEKIKRINPHFVPQVRLVPQPDQNSNQTFGRFYAVSVLRASKRPAAALAAALALSGNSSVATISQAAGLPPARRDLIDKGSGDPVQSVFYQSALVSKAWFDTNAEASTRIFRTMTQSILSGAESTSRAVGRASDEIVASQ